MNALSRPLHDLLISETRYVAPLFQRPYVWRQSENWEPLWEAVRDHADKALAAQPIKPHFLGAVVLHQVLNPAGTISVRQIIDGQQRLTTLQLFIKAARDVCGERGFLNLKQGYEQLCRNAAHVSNDPIEKFKVWPTNVDRTAFQKTMSAESPLEVLRAFGGRDAWQENGISYVLDTPDAAVARYLRRNMAWSEEARDTAWGALSKAQQKQVDILWDEWEEVTHLIPRAYLFFYAALDEWFDESPTPQNSALTLYNTLREQIVLVVIDLDAGEDAQQIYETMNSQGVRLLPAELVKNHLFREAELGGQNIEQLYTQKWEIFDEDGGWWRQEIKQGRLTRIRLDIFLQHYLALSTHSDVLATNLFGTFREWAKVSVPQLSAQQQIERFREYADIYQQFDSPSQPRRVRLFFERLKALEVTTVFPLLLEVFKRHQNSPADLEAILGYLESFLVRRMVCGLTTKGYNRYFLDLLTAREKANDFSPAAIEAALKSSASDSGRWPDDAEFETSWKTAKMYKSGSNERANMILLALERQMITSHVEPHQLSDRLTVEHLMPQSWQASYPLPVGIDPDDAALMRSQLVNTIGNLTLLTQKLNSSVSNGPWLTKRAAITSTSILRLNQSAQLPNNWDDATIRQRANDLWALALQIWPRS